MKNYKYILIAIIVFTLSSCGSDSETIDSSSKTIQEDFDNNSIGLNKGEKWAVVPEMMEHIKTMEADVKQFVAEKNTGYEDLAKELKSNTDLLISSCTMSGEAHNQLHKWLVPYIGLADDLLNAKNAEEGSKILEEIQGSLETFNTYFK